jgi:hypothetical protein
MLSLSVSLCLSLCLSLSVSVFLSLSCYLSLLLSLSYVISVSPLLSLSFLLTQSLSLSPSLSLFLAHSISLTCSLKPPLLSLILSFQFTMFRTKFRCPWQGRGSKLLPLLSIFPLSRLLSALLSELAAEKVANLLQGSTGVKLTTLPEWVLARNDYSLHLPIFFCLSADLPTCIPSANVIKLFCL